MVSVKWSTLAVVLFCFAVSNIAAQDDDFEDEVADGDAFVVDDEEPKTKKVGPLAYTTPSAPNPKHFADAFPSKAGVIGSRWVKSAAKKDGADADVAMYDGEWTIATPETEVLVNDYGLVLQSKARHHAISAKLDRPFAFDGTPFVMQYEVKFQNGQDCGGAYVKLLTQTRDLNLKQVTDKTPYTIMFGPDRCGLSSKLHLIVRIENPINHTIEEHHAKQPSSLSDTYFTDKMTHLYTLVIRADGVYSVLVDNKEVMGGNLNNDLTPAIEPERQINDPSDVKPSDWDEREKIDDPEAFKPDEWDESAPQKIVDINAVMPDGWLEDEPELVPDEEATKPDDWDEEMDGQWEAPSVSNPLCKDAPGCGQWSQPEIVNPEYKGKWKAPRITNPAYQGKWAPKLIDNPNYYKPDAYKMSPIGAIALELWTMSDGILFDNFIMTEDPEVAKKFAQSTFDIKVAHEKAMHRSENAGMAENFLSELVEAANDKPWLWAVYILVVLVPVVLIVVFCCTGSKSEPQSHKKTDAPQPDDDQPSSVDDESDEIGEELQMDPQPSTSGEPTRQRRQADLEDEEDEKETVPVAKKSPGRRGRARKE